MAEMNCSEFQWKQNLKRKFEIFSLLDCARDEKVFKNAGIDFNLRCKDNGNYDRIQDQNGKMFCVDDDGYAVSSLLEPTTGLNCDIFIYYEQEDENVETFDEYNYWQ